MFSYYRDLIQSYLRGWREAEVGGVRMLERRDEVERVTSYKHPRTSRSAKQHGIHFYIKCTDGEPPLLECWFKTGVIDGYTGFQRLVLNIDGIVARWEGSAESLSNGNEQTFIAKIRCDEAWLKRLEMVARSKTSVWRMAFEMRRTGWGLTQPDQRDFEVGAWNKRLITEVLAAYSSLVAKAQVGRPGPVNPQASSAPPTGTPPPQVPPVAWGPYQLMPDGSVTLGSSNLRLMPDGSILKPDGQVAATSTTGEIQVRGHKLKLHVSGAYILIDPQGETSAVQFVEGRWRRRRVYAAGANG